MRPGWALAAASAVVWLGACDGEAPHGREASRHGAPALRARAGVLAIVDGAEVTVEEAARFARATGLGSREVGVRLEERELLAKEAVRRGLDRAAEVERATAQAMVQALLRDRVEAAVDGASVRAEEVEQALRARTRDGVEPVLATYRAADPEQRRIRVEELPLWAAEAPAAPEFLRGLFSIPAEGAVPLPVRSRFGWHAIVVTEIRAQTPELPERRRSVHVLFVPGPDADEAAEVDARLRAERAARELVEAVSAHRREARGRVRDELIAERRARRLEDLVADLRRRAAPEIAPAGLEAALRVPLDAAEMAPAGGGAAPRDPP